MKKGRKPLYKSPEDLQKKVDEYFKSGVTTKISTDKFGNVIEKRIPTITGLALFLGFEDRHSFYEYEAKEEFTHTIKSARARIEQHYEELVQEGNSGAIFALKNFGWRDKQEIEETKKEVHVSADLSDKNAKELKDIFSSLIS